jgi:two-component system, LytTR family, sensor kinase
MASGTAVLESYLVSLLVKLGAVASIASVVARSGQFKSLLLRENRSIRQRLELALWLSVVFGASVGFRVVSGGRYHAADLGLEGSLIAGIVGGYVTGLVSGVAISLAAVFYGEPLMMPLLAATGVLGGLLRDMAPDPEEIWRFSPFLDLSIYRFFKERDNHRRTSFQLIFLATILVAEFVRDTMGDKFGKKEVFYLWPEAPHPHPLAIAALYAATLFAVAIPLKIWNNTRNEKKIEEQARLLAESRLAALTSQINPHFLFNTLNSVSALIRTDPQQARLMVLRLSKVLRRLLRKHENFSALRDELSFIEDYLSIEVVRFGDKLRFETDVAPDTLDMVVPSMIFQPLVENSIKHGLASKVEGGTIRIRTERRGPKLFVSVEDDGVGIPEERLGTLLEQGGIGVSNVNERLKVLFGSEYRMWVESQPGHGTRVEIEVPELRAEWAAAPAASQQQL